MSDLRDWAQQLSGLVVLAVCAAMAAPKPGFKVNALPAVGADKPVEKPVPKKEYLPPEVQEFMRLPSRIQKQVLGYGKNWIDANFERKD